MTVFIAQGTHTRSEIYHTKENCPYLKRATEIVTKEKESIDTHRELCSWCENGELDKSGHTEWHEINKRLKDEETTL